MQNVSKSKIEELEYLCARFQQEKIKSIKNHIFNDVAFEATGDKNNGVKNILRVKVNDIVLRHNLVNDLTSKENYKPLLDIEEFTNLELTFDEKSELKACVEDKLKENEENILKNVKEVLNINVHSLQHVKENIKYDLQGLNEILIETKKNIYDLQSSHIEAILQLSDTLLKLLDLRNSVAPESLWNKSQLLLNQSEKLNLRVKILENQTYISIFKNSSMTFDAYRMAYKDLKEKQKLLEKQIENLRIELKNYKILNNNEEYRKILDDYRQYFKTVENKKWLCNAVN